MSPTFQKLNAAERFNQLVERRKQTDTHWIEAAKDSIADEIYDLMQQEGVSKSELAERMGVSRQYVTKMLQGGANLTIETLVKVGLALGYRLRADSLYVAMRKAATPLEASKHKAPAQTRGSDLRQKRIRPTADRATAAVYAQSIQAKCSEQVPK